VSEEERVMMLFGHTVDQGVMRSLVLQCNVTFIACIAGGFVLLALY
jgi:hypothetical protein